MIKNILVTSESANTTSEISVDYSIDMLAGTQKISCEITGPPFPAWLRMKKFELLSLVNNNVYERIFNENSQAYNLQMDLFVDEVYRAIMRSERLTCAGY